MTARAFDVACTTGYAFAMIVDAASFEPSLFVLFLLELSPPLGALVEPLRQANDTVCAFIRSIVLASHHASIKFPIAPADICSNSTFP